MTDTTFNGLQIRPHRQLMKAVIWGFLSGLLLLLGACTSSGQLREREYFPGNVSFYNFGIGQSKENFSNIKNAQSAYGPPTTERVWANFEAGISPNVIGLNRYLPFSVRWELNDGRQFIVDDIDVGTIMKEYFKDKNNDITLPWQREGRPRDRWEYDPALVYEVKDGLLRVKWLITDIKTPPDQRFLPSGATTKWNLERKEYLVKEIKGTPTQGIDFNKKWEIRNNISKEQ